MSLNIVDSLLDKLSFVSKDKNIPFGKKFTGSRSFLGTNNCISQSIPTEFFHTSFIDNDFSLGCSKMDKAYSLDSKMNLFQYFDSTSDSLVGRVSRLFCPMLNSQDTCSIVPHCLGVIGKQEFLMHQGFKLLCDEVEHHFENMNKTPPKVSLQTDIPQMMPSGIEYIHKKPKKMDCIKTIPTPNSPSVANQSEEINIQLQSMSDNNQGLSISVEISSSPTKNPVKDGVMPEVTVLTNPIMNNNQKMNEELTSRKNKEVQKRSKKRRRRQKRGKSTLTADLPKVPTSPLSTKSDILCDIMTNVQFLLPHSSSFVIAIESAEEDSDWDSSNSDCDWLRNDCSEFELSGIFISNLSAPLSSSVCFSRLNVSSSPFEDAAAYPPGKVLQEVNDKWAKDVFALDAKPRLAAKVSFAPEAELVRIETVDCFDRKGEWETYALERARFRKRIDDLEKVIAPCLSKQHREKMLSRFGL